MSKFSERYQKSIKGKYDSSSNEEVPVGVHIRKLLQQVYKDQQDWSQFLSKKKIQSAFINYGSTSLTGFPPFKAFRKLLKPMLDSLVPKSTDLIENTYTLLEDNVNKIANKIFGRFPKLQPTIQEFAINIVTNHRNETNQ